MGNQTRELDQYYLRPLWALWLSGAIVVLMMIGTLASLSNTQIGTSW